MREDDPPVLRARRSAWPTRVLEGACAILMAVMVALLFLQVTARYVFRDAPAWAEEFARGALIYLTFVGAAVAVARAAHLKVDALTAKLSPTARRAFAVVGHVVAILFLAIVVYQGVVLLGQLSNQPLVSVPISKGFFFAAVPIGAALMLVYEAVRLRDVLRGHDPAETSAEIDPAAGAGF
jgi:TRAP-type C4-dicarboxylate transport system permease small subunit